MGRIWRARRELEAAVSALPSCIRFGLVAFDCNVYPWRTELVRATDENRAEAASWIRALEPQGANGLAPALVSALGWRENRLVYVVLDGGPNCGAGDETGDETCWKAHRGAVAQANVQRATIDVVAVRGSWPAFLDFARALAAENTGECFVEPR